MKRGENLFPVKPRTIVLIPTIAALLLIAQLSPLQAISLKARASVQASATSQPTSQALEPITAANASHIQQVARLGHGSITGSLSYSSDPKTLAVTDTLGLTLYPLDTPNQPRFFDSPSPCQGLAFSPDQTLVA